MTDVARVVIADDHRIFCDALSEALEKEGRATVVGVAADGRDAVRLVRQLLPDVVILDIAMPGMNGMEAARQIAALAPGTKMIALSMHSDRRYVTGMLSAGVAGYLLKECAFEELTRAIETVLAGHVYLSPPVAGVVVEDLRGRPEYRGPDSRLTPREREVLQLLAEGNRVQDIALQLHLSVKTVETHRRRITKKLGIATLAGLTKYALREGLTSLDE